MQKQNASFQVSNFSIKIWHSNKGVSMTRLHLCHLVNLIQESQKTAFENWFCQHKKLLLISFNLHLFGFYGDPPKIFFSCFHFTLKQYQGPREKKKCILRFFFGFNLFTRVHKSNFLQLSIQWTIVHTIDNCPYHGMSIP